jgi:homoserine kinase type II
VSRHELTEGHIAAMGEFLARIHIALNQYPPDQAHRRSLGYDRDATLLGIERLLDLIHTRPFLDDIDRVAIDRLLSRRTWLHTHDADKPPDLRVLEQQVIHGDYHEGNLFWEGMQVSAVIDWEQPYKAPRAWEVARTIHLVLNFEPAAARIFLERYRSVLPLPLQVLDQAVTAYGLMRAHDLWIYEAYYLEGNRRVSQYIKPGPFVPLTEQWATLRAALS